MMAYASSLNRISIVPLLGGKLATNLTNRHHRRLGSNTAKLAVRRHDTRPSHSSSFVRFVSFVVKNSQISGSSTVSKSSRISLRAREAQVEPVAGLRA